MNKKKFITYFVITSILLLVFQFPLSNFFQKNIGIFFENYDEIISFISFLVILFNLHKGFKITFLEMKSVIFYIFFLALGFLGTVINGEQPIIAYIFDMVNCSKFFITYIGFRIISRQLYFKKLNFFIINFSKVYTIILFVICSSFFFMNINKYGLFNLNLKLFYYHPVMLLHISVFLISILMSYNKTSDNYYILLLLFICFCTSTSKAYVIVVFYIMYYFYHKIKINYINKLFFLFLGGIIVAFITYDPINLYYLSTSARNTLTKFSFVVANRYFPFGSGFASYGSATAAKFYSNLYYDFRFEYIHGLSENSLQYLSDVFWPTIIAQFGYIGLIVFILFLYYFIKNIMEINKKINIYFSCNILIIVYLIILSTSSSSFFNPISVLFAIVLALRNSEYIYQSSKTIDL